MSHGDEYAPVPLWKAVAGVLLVAVFAVALAMLLLSVVNGAPGLSEERSRTLRCEVAPWGGDEVVVRLHGSCGESCGERVRWVAFLEPRIVWDRARGVEAWLEVLPGEPMYVEAAINGQKACGYRFVYNGDVHHLEASH